MGDRTATLERGRSAIPTLQWFGDRLRMGLILHFIAGALAGAAGLLYALYITNIRYDEGFRLGLIAFTAAVVGGIGNLPGAVLGGLLIAMIESFNNGLSWVTPGSDWTQSIIFSVLIVVLVFRPEGLLGERTPEGG